MRQTFFFYDLETSGLNPREDRIMQFAGQRTDMNLNSIGDPVNLLVKLDDDTLPSPDAIMVTKITPQQTKSDGLSEREFCRYVMDEIFTPGTIATGYNSVRFDDEFMRAIFWRNFFDPYEWQWRDGRSRWDLLDVVRLTRALRPEGINWPFQKKTKKSANNTDSPADKSADEPNTTDEQDDDLIATNRLELITKLNGIEHAHAHDALSDVEALISVTRLIKEKQPKLFEYLFNIRDKRHVSQLVNLKKPQPFVYASGRYSGKFNKTTIAYPLTEGRNNTILVYDLRYSPERTMKELDKKHAYFPAVKEFSANKCPAVAPLGVMSVGDGWQRIGLDEETVNKNLESLLKHPEMVEDIHNAPEPKFEPAIDPESAIYDGFLKDQDHIRAESVRNSSPEQLKNFHMKFDDSRLPELLLHYKARNYPAALDENELKTWEEYRTARLNRQAPAFTKALERLKTTGKTLRGDDVDPYILEELSLWYQSLL